MRTTLSIVGIAVAVASLVSVIGLSASAQAQLLAELGQESNLLTVAAGQTFSGDPTPLPPTAESMIRAIPPVESVTAVGTVPNLTVRRSAAVPFQQTSGISVLAAQGSLAAALSAGLVAGHFLGPVADVYPEVVLGYSAAKNLAIDRVGVDTAVFIDQRYFTVTGILAPVAVAPEIDNAALVSFPVARNLFRFDGKATRIYLRTDPDQTAAVAAVLPFTASPQQPDAVEVRRPSDILVARIAAKDTFTGLFLGLSAVALLVGGISIANVMVISVIERRSEIGLRRALGARSSHIAQQFLVESVLLSVIGGIGGVLLGSIVTVATSMLEHDQPSLPVLAVAGGIGASLVVGALAGLYPALRAARLPPSEALRN
jgi:putative ABC transport system permease protein